VAFSFNREISVSTDWNTEFVYEPNDELSFNQVSLCLNFQGECAGGDDVPRHVRFRVQHQPGTDYTWLVYAVQSASGNAMTEPYVVRYTTAPDIGQGQVSGAVASPKSTSAWTPSVRASMRTLVDGLKRSGLGRPVFDRSDEDSPPLGATPAEPDQPKAHFGTLGTKAINSGPFTQILLIDEFSIRESRWTVRAADALIGSSGAYSLDFVRPGSYVPIAVRYTDGSNTEIDALGFHDPDGDGTPNTVEVDGDTRANINLELFDFPLTTARNAQNLSIARDSAAQYASDQQLKIVQANYGARPAGAAYQWIFRFLSPQQDLETRVVIDPLNVQVDTGQAPGFLTEMNTMPDGFVDSDAALQTVLDNGGQEFIEQFRLRNLTTILQGGNLYWTETPVPIAAFWRVRLIGVTSSRVGTFERYIDMASGAVLDESDPRGAPSIPADFALEAADAEVDLSWAANPETDIDEYRLYRATSSGVQVNPENQIGTVQSNTTQYTDTGVNNGQPYYYRLTAVDVDGNESRAASELRAFPLPSTITVDAAVEFGPPEESSSYRLIALPGGQALPLTSVLDGDAGREWMAYWDDGTNTDPLVKFDGSSTFQLRPGRGFWVISRPDWTASRSVQAVNLRDDGTYAIDLHDGWNIISNPLDVDVDWSAVQGLNGVTQALWAWEGSFADTSAFASARNGRAYYFLNEQRLEELAIPYPGASEDLPAEAPKQIADASALTLTAIQDRRRTASVKAGLAPEASAGRDAYDQFAPPGYFETASLQFVNEQVDPTYTTLATEYRPSGHPGYTFDLTLAAAAPQDVQLHADGLEAFADRQVLLANPETGRTYDLHAQPTVRIHADEKATSLKLILGDPAYVDEAVSTVVPQALTLRPNYPNPFGARTTIEYTLPEQQAVELVIYDILGRRVRTLAKGDAQRAGVHRIDWDGRNQAGKPVSSGVYLARLTVEGQVKVRRMVLVR